MPGALAVLRLGHVFATLLAAIHALMLGRLARLHLMLCLDIGRSRSGRLSSGDGRGDQSHHINSPEFE
jgi:hypothetical protein